MAFKAIEHSMIDKILRVDFRVLNQDVIEDLVSLVRTIKQTSVEKVVLIIKPVEIVSRENDYLSRLDWSRRGQALTSLVESSSVPFIALIDGVITCELAELALSCLQITAVGDSRLNLCEGSVPYAPRWGALERLRRVLSDSDIKKIYTSYAQTSWSKYFSLIDILKVSSIEEEISKLNKEIWLNIPFKLCSYHLAPRPNDKNLYSYLETTAYLSTFEDEYFSKVKFLEPKKLESSLMKGEIQDNLDDFGNDFMDIDNYPITERKVLERKSRIEEVEKIISYPDMGIKGRCIELGSGYGYFSMLLSKKSEVDEAIAFDISVAELNRFGPFIVDLIKPDLAKLSYQIGDMNKLEDQYGTFDVVVFCASLHHSSDIPKSLEIAYKLLKRGGCCILHGEHYRPVFLSPKKLGAPIPETMLEFSQALTKVGFKAKVYKYALKGTRLYWLKKIIFETWPLNFFNGWIRVANYMVYGIK